MQRTERRGGCVAGGSVVSGPWPAGDVGDVDIRTRRSGCGWRAAERWCGRLERKGWKECRHGAAGGMRVGGRCSGGRAESREQRAVGGGQRPLQSSIAGQGEQ